MIGRDTLGAGLWTVKGCCFLTRYSPTTAEVAPLLVALCREGRFLDGVKTLNATTS